MIQVRIFLGVLLCGIIISVAVSVVNSTNSDKRLLYQSMMLEGVLSDAKQYKFSLSLKQFSGNDCLIVQQVKRYWGAGDSNPVTIIDKLSLSVSGLDYQIPPEAILDLGNVELPCGVFIGENTDSILVHIEGGTGQDAYNGRFTFVDSQLRVRLIEHFGEDGEWKHTLSRY